MDLAEILKPYRATIALRRHAQTDSQLLRRLQDACELPHVRVDQAGDAHWDAICRTCGTQLVVLSMPA